MTTVRTVYKRWSRSLEYVFRWLVLEKPRGLDFSMRMKSIEASGNHGYALTSRKALRNMLRDLPISAADRFLDIGCGKGGVLSYVSELSFGKVDGIEIDSQLVRIARENIQQLELSHRIEVIHADALSFRGYDKYNFFFLFNPFDSHIYESVIEEILKSVTERTLGETLWVLCYGASSDEALRKSGLFDLYRDEVCPHRNNNIHIWKSR